MKSLESKKKKKEFNILPGILSLSFISSLPFTFQSHQSLVTLLWSHDLPLKPLEQASHTWLQSLRAEHILKNSPCERAGETSSLSGPWRPRVDHWGHQQYRLGLCLHLLLWGNFPSIHQRKAWSVATGVWNTSGKVKPSGHVVMAVLEQLQWFAVCVPKHHLIVKTHRRQWEMYYGRCEPG